MSLPQPEPFANPWPSLDVTLCEGRSDAEQGATGRRDISLPKFFYFQVYLSPSHSALSHSNLPEMQ